MPQKSNVVNPTSTFIDEARSIHPKALELFPIIYELVQGFPDDLAELKSQMLRSANSVAANIAENAAKQNPKKEPLVLCNGLHISKGELDELESHLNNAESVHISFEVDYQPIYSLVLRLRESLEALCNRILWPQEDEEDFFDF